MLNKLSLSSLPRPFWLLLATIPILCILAAIAGENIATGQLRERNQQYGQSLANLAARRALDATVNRDLVSLQVILRDTAANASVVNATIHDVANNLLVQAGSRADNHNNSQANFTAPITVQDSVAGYVTITLDFSNLGKVSRTLYLLFTLLALGFFGVAVSGVWWWQRQPQRPTDKTSLPIVERPTPPTSTTAPEPSPPQQPVGELILQFHNLRALHQQLSQQAFRSLLQRLELQLRDVMALYGGQLLLIDADQVRLAFADSDHNQALFHGLCSAQLLAGLNHQSGGIQLRLSCLLLKRQTTVRQLKNLPYNLFANEEWQALLRETAPGTLLLETLLLEEYPTLGERLVTESYQDNDDLCQLTEVREPYRSLLEKQLSQLKSQHPS